MLYSWSPFATWLPPVQSSESSWDVTSSNKPPSPTPPPQERALTLIPLKSSAAVFKTSIVCSGILCQELVGIRSLGVSSSLETHTVTRFVLRLPQRSICRHRPDGVSVSLAWLTMSYTFLQLGAGVRTGHWVTEKEVCWVCLDGSSTLIRLWFNIICRHVQLDHTNSTLA